MHARRQEWLFDHGDTLAEDNLGSNATADKLSRGGPAHRDSILAHLMLAHPDFARVNIPQEWHPGWKPSRV
jgi:hypothetical protein